MFRQEATSFDGHIIYGQLFIPLIIDGIASLVGGTSIWTVEEPNAFALLRFSLSNLWE